jgi:hypothetical protein
VDHDVTAGGFVEDDMISRGGFAVGGVSVGGMTMGSEVAEGGVAIVSGGMIVAAPRGDHKGAGHLVQAPRHLLDALLARRKRHRQGS